MQSIFASTDHEAGTVIYKDIKYFIAFRKVGTLVILL